MSRNLVVCIDGTNNYPNGGYTNIQRLLRVLVRDPQQQAYYQPGVGTIEPNSLATRWGRRAAMAVDSMSGILLQRHVCSAYRYLMAQYQPGDTLYLFGFSRGAYAVRVLAGMLSKIGLLHPGFDEMVRFAWETYVDPANKDAAAAFRQHYCRDVPSVHFLGLFDTVSAIGLPWVPKTFPRTFNNGDVEIVRHAQALDEHRVMFVPNSWTALPRPAPGKAATDVKQVWFAGVHSDVGGGYPNDEAGLSRIALAWMVHEAAAAGLRFDAAACRSVLLPTAPGASAPATPEEAGDIPTADAVAARFANAPAHDELGRRWLWKLLEWLPIPRYRRDPDSDAWYRHWQVNRGRERHLPHLPLLHDSVRLRMAGGYQPRPTLPPQPNFVV